ncbi:MAG: DUF2783 domain-containing protein, partial [Burkholderiaceae bacterium]
AHQVSPFGARGANSGIQDADNLAWKLARVVKDQSPERLLDSYDHERVCAADENILNSTRSTDFITPKSSVSRVFRNATLDLANHFPFARSMVNSGRLSLPTHYLDSSLNTADLPSDHFACVLYPGSPMCDAPIMVNGQSSWLLRSFDGRFVLLFVKGDEVSEQVVNSEAMKQWIESANIHLITIDLLQQPRASNDQDPLIKTRLDLQPGNCWLMRPDQHLAARFRQAALDPLIKAFERATGQTEQPSIASPLASPLASSTASSTAGGFSSKQRPSQKSDALSKGLIVEPNFKDFDTPVLRDYQGNDRFYDMLINAHRNLSDDASSALNARLLLLLANHIGDVSVLQQAIEAAQTIQPSTSYKE